MKFPYNPILTDEIIDRALAEDLAWGDVTTSLVTGGSPQPGAAYLLAKQDGILSGIDVFRKTIARLDPEVQFFGDFTDGERFSKGDRLIRFRARTDFILMAERTALNLLQHMTGIATLTSQFTDQVKGTKALITDTRKTLPGLRILEKYAVRCGGGRNHRYCLSDMVLLKENHIACAGGITGAVNRVRERLSHPVKVEVEVTDIPQVMEALKCEVDVIMLDNFDDVQVSIAVELINHKALVEASGNVTPKRAGILASAGVDLISVGSLTHSAPAADVSLLLET